MKTGGINLLLLIGMILVGYFIIGWWALFGIFTFMMDMEVSLNRDCGSCNHEVKFAIKKWRRPIILSWLGPSVKTPAILLTRSCPKCHTKISDDELSEIVDLNILTEAVV